MPSTYRIYELDGSNHVHGVELLSAENDQDAIRRAKELKPSGRREIWTGDRLVGRVDGAADADGAALWL